MIGLRTVAGYLPEARLSNRDQLGAFEGVDDGFLDKIGIHRLARKAPGEAASDLCVRAYEALPQGLGSDPQCLVVCTQNPDYRLPHTAAVVHGKLGLPSSCAALDINLGCSGYVYSLAVAKSFMEAQGMTRGLVFTADPYSDILDPEDKNTTLLFGDAATATVLDDAPRFAIGAGAFATHGGEHGALMAPHGGRLGMDGRRIFNYVLRHAPPVVAEALAKNGMAPEEVDAYLFHQASRYIITTLSQRMKLPSDRVPFDIDGYGNTVSSSIPLLLASLLDDESTARLVLCGFGVGLSIGAITLRRLP